MRKRCKRKVYGTRPITFGMMKDGITNCRLLAASAIDAFVRGEATDEHISQVWQIADYCVRLALRLEQDGRVEQVDALASLKAQAELARVKIVSIQADFRETSTIEPWSDDTRAQMLALLDINDVLDQVCNQISVRLSRDVLEQMVEEARKAVRAQLQEAEHA